MRDSMNNKVLIFDWDDTICPSSFLDHCKVESYHELPNEIQRLLIEVSKCAAECLDAASKHGEVIIITNSDDGWVKFSAERYVPNLWPILKQYRIVSARTAYEEHYPGQPLCWKAAAFAHEVNETFSAFEDQRIRTSSNDSQDNCLNNSCDSLVSTDDSSEGSSCEEAQRNVLKPSRSRREVISFGDSMEERTAVQIVAGQLSSIPKSVMFLTTPTPVEIIGQLKMMTKNMAYVCDHSSSLDLEISPRKALKCAESHLKGVFPTNEIRKTSFLQRIQSLV